MKGVTINLTKKQIEQIETLRNGATGRYAILGQAILSVHPRSDRQPGTAEFYYCSPEQYEIIDRAIKRAKKL